MEQAEAGFDPGRFRHCQVRDYGDLARIELAVEDLPKLLEAGCRERLVESLKQIGYRFVTLTWKDIARRW